MRDLLPTDDEGMFRLDSDPEVHKYVGRKPVQTIDQSREVIEFVRAQYDSNGIGRWAIIEKETGAFIGWSGLKLITTEINGHNNYLDLGYRFIKDYWGRGYATETALRSVQYAWDELKATELYGMAHVDNAGSRNVLMKCGMQEKNPIDYEGNPYIWYELKK